MEKINTKDNNKKKYRLIKKFTAVSPFIPSPLRLSSMVSTKRKETFFGKFEQKNLTKDKQLKDGYISPYTRFCKSSTSVSVEKGGNKSRPQKAPKRSEELSYAEPSSAYSSMSLMRYPMRSQAPHTSTNSMSLPLVSFLRIGRDTRDNNQDFLKKSLPGREKAKKHFSELKNKFINLLMRDGEKSKASKLFADSLKQIEYPRRENKKGIPSIIKVFDFFAARKNEIDQKQHKQKKEKSTKISHREKQEKHLTDYYNKFLRDNILYQAVENIKPPLELRRVRKGGTTYQVPAIVSQKRQERLAIKWIIEAAEKKKKKNNRSNLSFSDCLVSEIMDAFNKTGQPRQKRDEQLKYAEFNRAYTRYRWW